MFNINGGVINRGVYDIRYNRVLYIIRGGINTHVFNNRDLRFKRRKNTSGLLFLFLHFYRFCFHVVGDIYDIHSCGNHGLSGPVWFDLYQGVAILYFYGVFFKFGYQNTEDALSHMIASGTCRSPGGGISDIGGGTVKTRGVRIYKVFLTAVAGCV